MARDKHLNAWFPGTFPSVCGNCSKPKIGAFTGARFAGICPHAFLPITAGRREAIVSTCSPLPNRFMIKVSTQYAVNLVCILVDFLSRSPIKSFLLEPFRHDSNVRFCFSMSGFLLSQILGWHSATGPATPIVKRFKLYMTSNADTRAVSNKTKSLIQERNVYEGREKPVTMRFLRLAWFRADRVSPRKVV